MFSMARASSPSSPGMRGASGMGGAVVGEAASLSVGACTCWA